MSLVPCNYHGCREGWTRQAYVLDPALETEMRPTDSEDMSWRQYLKPYRDVLAEAWFPVMMTVIVMAILIAKGPLPLGVAIGMGVTLAFLIESEAQARRDR